MSLANVSRGVRCPMRWVPILLLAVGSLLPWALPGCPPCCARPPYSRMEVFVRDEAGRPLAGATILQHGEPISSAEERSPGHWYLSVAEGCSTFTATHTAYTFPDVDLCVEDNRQQLVLDGQPKEEAVADNGS